MLKINNLVSGYGSVQILNGSNMEVKNQSIVALLGGNGTGKSTILNGLLDDDKAIISDIPGTTRDSIDTKYNL